MTKTRLIALTSLLLSWAACGGKPVPDQAASTTPATPPQAAAPEAGPAEGQSAEPRRLKLTYFQIAG